VPLAFLFVPSATRERGQVPFSSKRLRRRCLPTLSIPQDSKRGVWRRAFSSGSGRGLPLAREKGEAPFSSRLEETQGTRQVEGLGPSFLNVPCATSLWTGESCNNDPERGNGVFPRCNAMQGDQRPQRAFSLVPLEAIHSRGPWAFFSREKGPPSFSHGGSNPLFPQESESLFPSAFSKSRKSPASSLGFRNSNRLVLVLSLFSSVQFSSVQFVMPLCGQPPLLRDSRD